MIRYCLAAALACAAMTAGAQPPVLEPSVDSADQRQALRALALCLAEQRPNWARRVLSQAYMSQAQMRIASSALSGRDTCITGAGAELRFRISGIAGGLAEEEVRGGIGRADLGQISRALNTLEPRNVTEDFALCLTARDPVAARDLALSEFGSAAEGEAAARLARGLELCTQPNERLTVDLQSLRGLASAALYRAMTEPSGGT